MHHRRPCGQLIACFLSVAAFGTFSHAWGPDGHRITGEVAAEFLNDDARRAIEEILGNQSLADVSNWADDVREREEYSWTRPLHYVNVPRTATSVNMERDCANGMCVVGAIREYEKKLRDPDTSMDDRRDALRFLVHFVGDIHQPMHVSYRDDLGGNRIDVTLFGQDTNLHRAWDTGLIRARMGDRGPRALTNEIKEAIRPEMAEQWGKSLDPVQWANESLRITRRIYQELPRDGVLGQAYYDRNISDVLVRLAMAGVRMAALLNDIYKSEDDEPVEPDANRDPETVPSPAMASLRIVEGEECAAGGKMMYLENTEESRLIEARVEQTWEDRGRGMSTQRTVVVRPGSSNRQRLGCSRQGTRPGEARAFQWRVVDARFR